MPLFKGLSSKSTPKKAIDYITHEDKAAFVSVRNLFEDEDYAEQFADTMRRFGKGKKFDERKYYHFKLSCARKDNVSPEQAHLYAEELAAILFPDDECVIATHTDTKTVHSHIIVNAVNPITGKKLRFTKSDYTEMKDEANRLGSEFGYTQTDFRKKAQNKRTTQESHIILKGSTSWKEDLREVIEEAKRSSTTQEEFVSHLALYGVSVTRSKTEYSYLHPQKKKAIRGLKLGNNYTKKEIENVIEQNRHRRNSNSTRTVAGAERTKAGGLG
ncbi:MAG: relaxase/mobilization nuclease domain-containing protein, partial [Clostridia bacterium]|nr:relaxase/mobilization nuclease domain-containing protein [Clostridia bacterium]